jgi:hypothetical protein
VRERDHCRHLAVGAGAPSDPDDRDVRDARDDEPVAVTDSAGQPHPPLDLDLDLDDVAGFDDPPGLGPRPAGDVVQAVADFVDDLVDDPTFGDDSHHTRCTRTPHPHSNPHPDDP